MTTEQLVIPVGVNDVLWRATIPGLSFVDKAPSPSISSSYGMTTNHEGVWVAHGNDHVATSTDDGATWTTHAVSNIGASVHWDGSRFVSPLSTFTFKSSADGVTWSTIGSGSGPAESPQRLHMMKDRWVAYTTNGSFTDFIMISADRDVEGGWTNYVASVTPSGSHEATVDDGDDLIVRRNGTDVEWYAPSTFAAGFTTGARDTGVPTKLAFGPAGGAWFAGSTITGNFYTSADGKTWSEDTDAALAGWDVGWAYWDGATWWVTAKSGGNVALFEFDPAGPTWTQHADLPDAGAVALGIFGRQLAPRFSADVADVEVSLPEQRTDPLLETIAVEVVLYEQRYDFLLGTVEVAVALPGENAPAPVVVEVFLDEQTLWKPAEGSVVIGPDPEKVLDVLPPEPFRDPVPLRSWTESDQHT